MYSLRLLGTPCVVDPDDVVLAGPAAQRHRLALLALLALAPAPGMSRDKLMAYLWPESDNERARHLLKQAVYVLRGTLGADAIATAGDELRLKPTIVRVDVDEFDSALRSGDLERAVALYRGPFLDGFFLGAAPDFERWAEQERERLAGAYARSLEGLAEAAEGARDFTQAVEIWKRRAAQDLYDSRVAMRLMAALEAAGNRGGALRHGNLHAQVVRDELGVDVSPELTDFVHGLRQQGTLRPGAMTPPASASGLDGDAAPRLELAGSVADSRQVPPDPSVLAADATPASTAAPPARARTRRALAYTAAVLVAGAAVLLMARGRRSDGALAGRSVSAPSLAVLPLASRGENPGDAALADGITRELINVLSRRAGLRVSASTSVSAFRDRAVDVRSVGDSLRVSHVLEGDLQRSGSRLRVRVRLIDARDGLTRWSETYDREFSDIFAVEAEIAEAVARGLGLGLGTDASAGRPRQPTRSIAAYELYLRGSDPALMRTDSAALRRLDYFRQAVELDPMYAAAHAALAITYIRLSMGDPEGFSQRRLQALAETAAVRAVALDDSFAEAHITLAQVRMRGREYRAAEEQLTRAVGLEPTSSHAYQTLAGLYLMTERAPQGLAAAAHALTLDSLSPGAVAMLAHALLFNGRCAEAREQLQKIATVQPPLLRAGMVAAECSAAEGRWAEAIAALEPQGKYDAVSLAMAAYLYARAGRRAEALRIRGTLLDRWRDGRNGAFQIAMVHAGLGELDQAFTWIDRALDDGSLVLNPFYGAVMEPVFEELRADPRFQRVRQRLGLPAI